MLLLLPLKTMSQEISDTVVVNTNVRFDVETVVSKTGKTTEHVYAVVDNVYYDSNKTSMQRYNAIRRFNGIPTVVLITTGKTRKQRIIVL